MKTKLIELIIIIILLVLMSSSLCFAGWDNTLPADNTVWNVAAGYIRNNWDALEAVFGVDFANVSISPGGTPNVYNVKNVAYGATGDGVTDDLIAIQAAVDACIASTTGGVVYFPPGIYSVDDGSITVNNGGNRSIWFIGAGMHSARIVKTTTGTGDLLIWDCIANPSGVQNLGIETAVGGNYTVDGISCTAMNGVFFENVWVGGFKNGFNIVGSDTHLLNCASELNSVYGFDLDKHITATNCISYQNGYGYILRYTDAPAYPDLPISLVNCSDVESEVYALTIYSRDNVEISGFTIGSADYSTNVGIYIDSSNHVNITGGNIRYLADYGIQLTGACSEITINGMQIHDIGQTTDGAGILLNASCTDVLITNCSFQEIRLSAIKTINSSQTRITNNIFRDFGREEVAGDQYGVLLDGDAAYKGATVSSNHFTLQAAETQTGISFEAGAQGKFFIRENEYINGTLMDLTDAPATTIVEQNEDDYAIPALADEATPSAKGRLLWKTGGTTNITDFDDGHIGQIITVLCKHSLTFDTTTAQDADHNLDGSSVNISVDTGDVLVWLCENGTTWHLISNLDASADNN